MILRLARFDVPPERAARFRELYTEHVLPALSGTQGCLSARLLQDTALAERCLSMTLWESARDADAYADSGLFDRLLDATDEALVDTGARRLPAGERPPLPDPEVDTWEVRFLREDPAAPFVRILTLRIEPGRTAEFRRRYAETVVPAMVASPGCLGLALAGDDRPAPTFLSVTLWASEEDAVRYEASGTFDLLTTAVSDLLSGLYRFALAPAAGSRELEGKDLEAHGYRVLAGGPLR